MAIGRLRAYSQGMRLRATTAASLAAAALVLAVPAGVQAGSSVKAPKDGNYSGATEHGGTLTVKISGKSIEIAAIQFKCHDTVGHTSLQDIPLKKTKRGYKFGINAHSIVSYDDGYPDENAPVEIWGRFFRGGKAAKGTVRVRAPRCGTGLLAWRIRR
ncbi:MAG: hypothetical protein QOJ14_1812 [Thermoleophilaceae bacterium]|nr:hypothetical protein [Thermoleophilaceae bacterium]